MIDPSTLQEFQAAQKAAQRKGTALVEELDARGLLATNLADRQAIHTALEGMSRELEYRGASSLMRMYYQRPHGTPAEMFVAVLAWMESYVSSRRV